MQARSIDAIVARQVMAVFDRAGIHHSFRTHVSVDRRAPGADLLAGAGTCTARRRDFGIGLRPDWCSSGGRAPDAARCHRTRRAIHRRRGLRVSRPSSRRLRCLGRIDRIRDRASCRAAAGGRTGHRVLHLASRPRGRDDRHGRQGRRARCSGDSHRDHGRLASRSRPPRNPDHRRGAGAGALGDVFTEHRLGPAHDPRDRFKRCYLPDRIPVRRSISTAFTLPGPRWRSRGFSIWSASKCFEGRRARCMDGTPSAGR